LLRFLTLWCPIPWRCHCISLYHLRFVWYIIGYWETSLNLRLVVGIFHRLVSGVRWKMCDVCRSTASVLRARDHGTCAPHLRSQQDDAATRVVTSQRCWSRGIINKTCVSTVLYSGNRKVKYRVTHRIKEKSSLVILWRLK
jgi:hypothetical protein